MIPKKKLSDIAVIYNGNSINKTVKQQKYMKDVPGWNYIGTKDIDFDGSVTYKTGVVIPFSESKFRTAPAGTVFVCSEGGSAGKKTAIIKEEVCFGNKLFAIVNKDNLFIPQYVYYYTRYEAFLKQFKLLASTLMGGITAKNFGSIEIPLFRKEEQKRIVSRIEEIFSSLDNAVEMLNKTKEQLIVYRQAVLEEEFKEEEKWEQCSLGSLMTVVRNGYGSKPDDCGAYRILTIGSVRALNLDLNNYRLNNTPFNDDDLIAENDLLFTRYNGNADFVGCCARVPQICEHYAYPDKLIKFRPKLNNIYHSKYLEYFVSHGNARKYLRSKIKTTSGQNGIAGSDIKKLVVFLPTLEKQTEIVLRIEERISRCNTVEVTVNKALQEAEAMRQSILKEAFEGRLN